ncbi:hypothetical protein PO002_38905 [Cupriavidus necator]|uniref:hypothetical protein n=1 Tax=Cupriavidus necator TaxID=106590 RepID=UPI0039C46B59
MSWPAGSRGAHRFRDRTDGSDDNYQSAAFVDFKRWMASTADRDPLKVSRDRLQASIVEELANRFQLGV